MPKKSKKRRKAVKPPSRKAAQKDFMLLLKSDILSQISDASGLRKEELPPLEKPPEGIEADFALPCFMLSRKLKKDPKSIASNLAHRIKPMGFVLKAGPAGPYLNFLIDWNSLASEMIPHIIAAGKKYGSSQAGRGKTIVIDFSGPNVAKPMSVGHLRSTIIGDCLCRIYSTLGYKVVGDDHLGDWGTQFGKIIVAYKKWGKPDKLKESPIQELLRLYVRYHDEAEANKKLEKEAREAFRKLESGDRELLKLWRQFVDLSIKEFQKTYKALGVRFDLMLGESFYNKAAKQVIKDARKKGIAKWSQNALVIETGHENPLLIQKSDEATLYSTRELAAIRYRLRKFRPEKILYVIGSEQKSYLEQVFAAAQKLGYMRPEEKEKLVHIQFGMVSLPEGKMSTRMGRIILLDHLIDEVTRLADKTIQAKNPSLKNRKKIALEVGAGAIKYADLSRDRIKDLRFDWNEMLSFEGDTGPYIQYTHARACSILRKGKIKAAPKGFEARLLKDSKEKEIIRKLAEFPGVLERAAQDCKPHYIANYLFSLANSFNEFYQSVPVLKAGKGLKEARLALVVAAKTVLNSGLRLLGIDAPEEM